MSVTWGRGQGQGAKGTKGTKVSVWKAVGAEFLAVVVYEVAKFVGMVVVTVLTGRRVN